MEISSKSEAVVVREVGPRDGLQKARRLCRHKPSSSGSPR